MSLFLARCIRCPLSIVWLLHYLFQSSSMDKHTVSGKEVRGEGEEESKGWKTTSNHIGKSSCGFKMYSHCVTVLPQLVCRQQENYVVKWSGNKERVIDWSSKMAGCLEIQCNQSLQAMHSNMGTVLSMKEQGQYVMEKFTCKTKQMCRHVR